MREATQGTCRGCGRLVAITKLGRTYNHHNLKGKPCWGRRRYCKELPFWEHLDALLAECRQVYFEHDGVMSEAEADARDAEPYTYVRTAIELVLSWDVDDLFLVLEALQETGAEPMSPPEGIPTFAEPGITPWLRWLIGLALEPMLFGMDDVSAEDERRSKRLGALLATQ